MPDKDGYPTIEELKELELLGSCKDILKLLEHLKEIWWFPDRHIQIRGKRVLRVWLHTGGWSGNEECISVLKGSFFWLLYWERSERGGHYHFRIPLKQNTIKKEANVKA